MRCTIWHHLHNLKNVKNTQEGVLLLVKLQAKTTLLKVTLLHEYFLRFLNCTNDTKSRKASHIFWSHTPIFTPISPALCKKCPYSEFFWSVFSRNAGKYGPEKLRLRTLFMQCR